MALKVITPNTVPLTYDLTTTPLATLIQVSDSIVYIRAHGYWVNLSDGNTTVRSLFGFKIKEVTLKQE